MKRSIVRTKPPRKPTPKRPRSAAHPASKLTDVERRQIIKLYKKGATQTALAKRFGVTQSCVSHIYRVQREWLE